jgi:hypothetical protein
VAAPKTLTMALKKRLVSPVSDFRNLVMAASLYSHSWPIGAGSKFGAGRSGYKSDIDEG